jgi:hypothetical protein
MRSHSLKRNCLARRTSWSQQRYRLPQQKPQIPWGQQPAVSWAGKRPGFSLPQRHLPMSFLSHHHLQMSFLPTEPRGSKMRRFWVFPSVLRSRAVSTASRSGLRPRTQLNSTSVAWWVDSA